MHAQTDRQALRFQCKLSLLLLFLRPNNTVSAATIVKLPRIIHHTINHRINDNDLPVCTLQKQWTPKVGQRRFTYEANCSGHFDLDGIASPDVAGELGGITNTEGVWPCSKQTKNRITSKPYARTGWLSPSLLQHTGMQLFDAIPWQWYILVPVFTFSTWNKPISLPAPHCNKERMVATYLAPWSSLGHSRSALSCPALQRKWQSLHPPVRAWFHPQLLQPHPCSAMDKKTHIKDKSHSCIAHDSASHTLAYVLVELSTTVFDLLFRNVLKICKNVHIYLHTLNEVMLKSYFWFCC